MFVPTQDGDCCPQDPEKQASFYFTKSHLGYEKKILFYKNQGQWLLKAHSHFLVSSKGHTYTDKGVNCYDNQEVQMQTSVYDP